MDLGLQGSQGFGALGIKVWGLRDDMAWALGS